MASATFIDQDHKENRAQHAPICSSANDKTVCLSNLTEHQTLIRIILLFFFSVMYIWILGTLCLQNEQIQWLDNRHRICVYEEVVMRLAIDQKVPHAVVTSDNGMLNSLTSVCVIPYEMGGGGGKWRWKRELKKKTQPIVFAAVFFRINKSGQWHGQRTVFSAYITI